MSKYIFTLFFFASITSYAKLTAEQKALHVLNRFSYGPSPQQTEELALKGEKGLELWFDQQLSKKNNNAEKSIQEKLKAFRTLALTNEELLKFYPQKNQIKKMSMNTDETEGGPKEIVKDLVMQKILRAVESENQLEEVLLDFWFNHFNVNFDKGAVKHAVTSFERDVIRPHIFGKFEDMLLSTAKSPAMLIYLDNNNSRKGKINENYARELLELHTLGVDGGYTQKDIQETARVFTGWGVEKPRQISEFKFFKKQHDDGLKTILGVSYQEKNGLSEGEKLILNLAKHKNTARFIAKKIAVKFISDEPQKETVEEIAKVFIDSGGDLKQVYKAVYQSKEFWQEKSVGAKIKTPFEYLVSAIRLTGAEFTPSSKKINMLKSYFDQSGQSLYRCQVPTGFKATADFWVNPGAMVNRINISLSLIRNQIPQIQFKKSQLLSGIENKKYANQLDLLNYLNDKHFDTVIKKSTLEKLNALLRDVDSYKDDSAKELPLYYYPTEKILALMLSTPEYQRR